MKINTELTCWRKCFRKYPSNEKKKEEEEEDKKKKEKKEKKKRKEKKRKEKKNCPTSFLAFCKDFFFTRSARQISFFALLF